MMLISVQVICHVFFTDLYNHGDSRQVRGDSADIPPVKLVSLEKKVKSFMTKTGGIPSDLVDAVTLPLTPVHQVLKHSDAEWVLEIPGV